MTEANSPQATEDQRTPERKALEAQAALKAHMRHGLVGMAFAERTTGFDLEWSDAVDVYGAECAATRKGDLGAASNMLTAQAMTLDAVFTDMLGRSSRNLSDYPEAAERYMRMALKAQAQSRATIEALGKLHQPREQTVRHVHIDNRGGQAVVAETVHTGGSKTEYAEQSYGPADACPISPALLGEDATWHGVPVPGDEWKEAVPDPRRQGGSADGQS